MFCYFCAIIFLLTFFESDIDHGYYSEIRSNVNFLISDFIANIIKIFESIKFNFYYETLLILLLRG